MKCLVCGYEFKENSDGMKCPICNWKTFAVAGDYDASIKEMQPEIDAQKKELLRKLEIWIETYRWKDENGSLKLDKKEQVRIGTGSQLVENAVWANKKFARIPNAKTVKLACLAIIDGREFTKEISVPNLTEAELQEVGASLDMDMRIRIMLRNSSSESASEKEPLFA